MDTPPARPARHMPPHHSPIAVQSTSATGWISTPHISPDHRGPVDQPYTPFPDASLDRPIIELLSQAVMRHSMRTAFDGIEGPTSFATLWRAICHLTQVIATHPVASGPIGVLLPTSASYAAAVYACLAAGRVCVPLDAGYPAERNADIAAVTGIGLVLTTSGITPAWPGVSVLTVEAAFDDRHPTPALPAKVLAQGEPAFILCTSGSTGRPKAIVYSQRTMLHWARSIRNALHVGPDDRVVDMSSPSSLGGMMKLFIFPLAGAAVQTVQLATDGFRKLLNTLSTRPVTILAAGPSLLRTLVQLPDAARALKGLRAVNTYGEALLKADLKLLRTSLPRPCPVLLVYASTEASGFFWFAGDPDDHDPVRVAAGTLMPDTDAMIVDEDGRVCAPGEAGELLIRSRYNSIGEWVDGHLTPGRLTPDPEAPSLRIYRTGDIARRNADGVFVVLGRKDRMLKINGQRLEPAEIEAALCRSPEVAQAAVIGRRNGTKVTLIAFVTPSGEAGLDLPALLRRELRAALPAFMRPSRIIVLDTLPLLPGGKRDEAALLALAG